jgi:hypothetical protein
MVGMVWLISEIEKLLIRPQLRVAMNRFMDPEEGTNFYKTIVSTRRLMGFMQLTNIVRKQEVRLLGSVWYRMVHYKDVVNIEKLALRS